MSDYRKLQAWQVGMKVARCVKRETDSFPKHELLGMTSQMRRAAVSIPSNLAEGSQRGTSKEFRQFVNMARGSCAELETLAILSVDFGYLTDQSELHALADRRGRILTGLAAALGKRETGHRLDTFAASPAPHPKDPRG